MNINEIAQNNRLEINYYIEKEPYEETYKGIVLALEKDKIIFVTELGEKIELYKDRILSVRKNNFDKIVSDNLTVVKNYYLEIYELEKKLEELKKQQENYIQKMFDAKFLSKFNIIGAVNCLNNYFKDKNTFNLGDTKFEILFGWENGNEKEIFLLMKSSKLFEFFDTDDSEELNRAMETYAPSKKKDIEKVFPYVKDLYIKKRDLLKENDNLFNAIIIYEGSIELSKNNFLDTRQKIENTIQRLNKQVV